VNGVKIRVQTIRVVDDNDRTCGLCQNWHETDLGSLGICYTDDRTEVTYDEDTCNCGCFASAE